MQSKDMKSLMDAYSQVILGESVEIDEARQMKDPKKDSMVQKGGKTIVIDKSKEKEYLKKGWELAEKKKLDPVDDAENDKKFKDREDKDIDNDGDVDSSDEYLHKKRAATDDAIDGGKKPAKKEGNAFTQALKAAKDKGDDTFVVAGKKYDVTTKEEIEDEGDEEEKEAPKVAGKKDDKKKVASNAKTAEISKIGEDFDLTDAITDLHKMWESAAQKSNATKPEEIDSKESPKSKEFSKKHTVDKTDEEETHETASKAGRATKANSGKGSIDSKKGDNKIVKSTEVKEEVELDEALKTTHVIVDTAQGNKIISSAAGANAEKNLRNNIASAEKPPLSIKDKKTLKIVQLKKPVSQKKADDMMGQPLKEEATQDIIAQAQNIINGKSIDEIADLTSDKPKNAFDGRTREAKAFLERMAKRRG
jgi:hypothetical protein